MESQPTFGDYNRGVQVGTYIDSSESSHGKRQKITEWLAPVNFIQKQNDVFSNHQPGTGQWFLNSKAFNDWRSGKSRVLWCHSIPGSGKTVLTSIAVDYLQELYKEDSEVGVACIYCEYKQQDLQTPTNLLASIWRQLDQWKDESHADVQDLYNRRGRFGTKPTLVEVVSILRQELWRHSVVYILIDALDECADDGLSRDVLIAKLEGILAAKGSKSTRIQLLVTSRSPDNMFSSGTTMQIQAAGEDVKSFVSQRFVEGISRSRSISEDVRKNEKLKEWIIETVIEKADTIFLMARLHLDSLKYKTNLGDLREAVRCFPKGLDELYKDTWTRIASQDPEWRTLAHRTLGWLSSNFRQLRAEELRHGLAVKSDDTALDTERLPAVDVLCESCHGLVTIDEESQIVRLVHRTTQEFFDRHRAQYFPNIHTQIARTCLDYLMFDVFAQGRCDFISTRPFDMLRIEGPLAASRFLPTRLKRNPFLEYAADHWGDHARGEATERALESEILALLKTPKALACTIQTQYRDASLRYGRSLDSSKHTPIHVAASFALEYIVKALLRDASGLDLNAEDDHNKTAFHWAAESGLAVCARLLLTAGADIKTQDDKKYTALYKASAFGHASIVKMILEQDKSAKLKKQEVHCAILSNQKLVIETYIRAAPKPADRANLILMESSALGKPEIIQLAVSLGADTSVEDTKGRAALLVAVDNGHSTAVQALLIAGASTNVLDESGRSLLQVAASSQNIFLERLENIRHYYDSLAETGDPGIHQLPVHIADDPRRTFLKRLSRWVENAPDPLMDLVKDPKFIAALNEDHEHPDIIRMLLNNGADLRVKTSEGETVLHLAIGSASRVKILLERGAQVLDIDARDNRGRSALHYAAAAGNHAAMEILLANRADVTLRDVGRVSTLHFAVNHPACVRMAILQGSSTKAVDSQKRTPLHYHAMMEQPDSKVFDQLREAGVDPYAVDSQGMTAFHYLNDPGIDSHDSEEIIRFIGMQIYERYALQEIRIRFQLRESSAQALRDNSRFTVNMNKALEKNKKWWIVPDDEIVTD